MSEPTESAEVTNLRSELARLRLLLERVAKGKRSYLFELEPGPKGFYITTTGIKEADEAQVAHMVADYMNVLWQGSMRFSFELGTRIRAKEVDEEALARNIEGAISDEQKNSSSAADPEAVR